MFEEFLTTENLLLIITGLVILVATLITDRLVCRAIARYSRKIKLEEHVENVFKLIARIIIFSVGVAALLPLFGVSAEWFIGLSALTGAAIGFASTQTVGNFLAGLYIMISRPFMVKDYVKIGNIEGEVREVTVNYTKVYTPTYNIVEIPNRKVLDNTILNYSGERNIIDYSFKMGFPHFENVTNKELMEECRVERGFLIRMFFPEGKVKTFYNIQPELMQDIVNSWDAYKGEKARG